MDTQILEISVVKLVKKFLPAVVLVLTLLSATAFAAQNVCNADDVSKFLNISSSDVNLYKKIFREIKKENFKRADTLTSKLDNKILLGHVLAEKYLSKTYNSNVLELRRWLQKYSDLPQVQTLYLLALKKGGKQAVADLDGHISGKIYSPYSWFSNPYSQLPTEKRKYIRKQVSDFRRFINKGKTRSARAILENKKFRMIVPDREHDAMSATLGMVYLLDNEYKLAWERVQKPVRRSNDSMALWVGGLAAWQMKQYKNSARFFAKLGAKNDADEWLVAAGAYWAYRSYARLGNKVLADKNLAAAAKYKRTFYGMLANYQLGQAWDYNWDGIAYINDYTSNDYIKEMLSSAAIQRAIILLQAKNKVLAEKEIRAEYVNLNRQQKEALLFLVRQYDMLALSILLANDIKDNESGRFYDEAAYPLPTWKPADGWKIDKALVWALVRQESAFSPLAKSGAGACGLMQLMPDTAVHISKNPALKKDVSRLYETSYNLALGQKYVAYLSEKPFINGNMFFLIAAYNAGPGNLYKWQKNLKYHNDPLLFIEIIPARETRIYIERVMANFWMYQARFGMPYRTMNEILSGKWPML